MLRAGLFVGGLLAALAFSTDLPAAEGKKYALLIGVQTYDPQFLTRLRFAERDAKEMAAALQAVGFEVTLMTGDAELPARKPTSATKILDQVKRRLSGLTKDDTLVVTFSGHGVQYKSARMLADGTTETHFFCPEEANLTKADTLVPLSQVYTLIETCPAERKLLIVDACRNEVLSEPAKSGREIELEPAGLQPRTVPKGMLALYSCTQGEKSYEWPELQHGVFCYHALKYLKGQADTKYYFQDQIGIRGLADYTSRETRDYVFAKLSADQLPELVGRTSDWPIGDLTRTFTDALLQKHNPSVLLGKAYEAAVKVMPHWTELSRLAELQARAGDVDAALKTASLVQEPSDRSIILRDVARNSFYANDVTEVFDSARSLPPEDQGQALSGVVDAFVKFGLKDRAVECANLIGSDRHKMWANASIAKAYFNAKDTQTARLRLLEAQAIADRIEHVATRDSALRSVVDGYIDIDDLIGAQNAALSIPGEGMRGNALRAVVAAYAQKKNFTMARQVAQSTDYWYYRLTGLEKIAEIAIEENELSEAIAAARQMESKEKEELFQSGRCQTLCDVANAYSASGQILPAKRLLQEAISIQSDSYEALTAIAVSQIRLGNLPDALAAANKISVLDNRETAVANIAAWQLIGGDPSGAVETIDQLPESSRGDAYRRAAVKVITEAKAKYRVTKPFVDKGLAELKAFTKDAEFDYLEIEFLQCSPFFDCMVDAEEIAATRNDGALRFKIYRALGEGLLEYRDYLQSAKKSVGK